jgi:hypothetical protein
VVSNVVVSRWLWLSRSLVMLSASPVVGAAADLATGTAEQHQHQADNDQDDSDGPEEGDGEYCAEEEADKSSDDHAGLYPATRDGKPDCGMRIAAILPRSSPNAVGGGRRESNLVPVVTARIGSCCPIRKQPAQRPYLERVGDVRCCQILPCDESAQAAQQRYGTVVETA